MAELPPKLERYVHRTDTCWIWVGSVKTNGYGVVGTKPFYNLAAHRVVYTLLVGPIPPDLQLDHLCRVKHCVNPRHLEAVTGQVNVRRSHSPAAKNAAKTHCVYGHPFTSDNIYLYHNKRHCRTCRRDRERRACG